MSGFTKGGRDYLNLGTYNIMCAYCGRKRKANELVLDDEFARGLLVCKEHRDLRHPQEFARGIKEDMTVPKVQPPIIAFTSVPAGFPLSIIPNPVTLVTFSAFVTAGLPPWIFGTTGFTADSSITADSGDTADSGFFTSDPSFVYVTSYLWTWKSGGVGILIVSPGNRTTQLLASTTPVSGVLQLVVTNSLGQSATATVSVTG